MTDITPSRDCGNSPKNQFAEQIAIALETGDIDFLSDVLDDGIAWETADGEMTGSEAVLVQMAQVDKPSQLRIDHVITHGKVGAVNGVADSKGVGRARRFCHVLTFTNTKCQTLRRVTSFSD